MRARHLARERTRDQLGTTPGLGRRVRAPISAATWRSTAGCPSGATSATRSLGRGPQVGAKRRQLDPPRRQPVRRPALPRPLRAQARAAPDRRHRALGEEHGLRQTGQERRLVLGRRAAHWPCPASSGSARFAGSPASAGGTGESCTGSTTTPSGARAVGSRNFCACCVNAIQGSRTGRRTRDPRARRVAPPPPQ
jgi:hypothetical protein